MKESIRNSSNLNKWCISLVRLGIEEALTFGGLDYWICVKGNLCDDKMWTTSTIVDVLDARTIVTLSGKIYHIVGPMNIDMQFPLDPKTQEATYIRATFTKASIPGTLKRPI
eukprot:jgi/Hompol1/5406/HPOL_004435-RA